MNATDIDYSKLLQIKGVDGYLILDMECDILESHIPDGVVLNQIQGTIKDMLQSQKVLNSLETTLMLTEKGVLQISRLTDFYLVIIAGYSSSVDVTKLASITDELKAALAT